MGACTLFLSPEEMRCADSIRSWFPALETVCVPKTGERKILCTAPKGADPGKYADVVRLALYGSEPLTHRSILGSVMATGVQRDRLGDIRTADAYAEMLVKQSVADFLAETLQQVGRQTVRVERTDRAGFTLEDAPGTLLRIVIASPRLDAVIAAVTKLARSKAQEKIRRGDVKRNHMTEYDVKRVLEIGDVLSVRGYGRYHVLSQEGTTKKGNLVFTVSQNK